MKLYKWQEEAILAHLKERRGITDACTGSGKTLMAIHAFNRCNARDLQVVVPTIALQNQWVEELENAGMNHITLHGGGRKSENTRGINVWVQATGRKILPTIPNASQSMLILDECHKAGAEKSKNILSNDWKYVIGLSATHHREDISMTRLIGPVVYFYPFERGIKDKIIRPVTVYNVGYSMDEMQQREYDRLTRKIDNIKKELLRNHSVYITTKSAKYMAKKHRNPTVRALANTWTLLTTERKRNLYAQFQRVRIAKKIIDENEDHNVLVISQLIETSRDLAKQFEFDEPNLYWSGIDEKEKQNALKRFLNRETVPNIMFSAQMLVEGIDIPSIDLVLILSSSSGSRQFIQSIGRCVRKGLTPESMVVRIYCKNTSDTIAISALRDEGVLSSERIVRVDADGDFDGIGSVSQF